MSKPALFIGSSTEGLEFARAVRGLLNKDCEVKLWDEDFATPGRTFIQTLTDALPTYDFAVLVFTPDDFTVSRKKKFLGPRDNVIFELGLFMGQLGHTRTLVLCQGGGAIKIPTDLNGLTLLPYDWPRKDGSHTSAIGAACDELRRLIRSLGIRERKLSEQIEHIRQQQADQQLQIDAIDVLLKTSVPWPERGHLWGLKLDKPFPFTKSEWFEAELRRLRAAGLIDGNPGVSIAELPASGDLKDFFFLTERGLQFLEYSDRFGQLRSPLLNRPQSKSSAT